MRDLSIPIWPDVFRPAQCSATIDRPLLKGPKPLDGREQVVASSAGGWLINYEGVPVYGDNYAAFRKLWIKIAALGLPVYINPDLITTPASPVLTTFGSGALFAGGATLLSGAFSSSDWNESGSMVRSASPDTMPDGTVTGTILTDSSAGSAYLYSDYISVPTDTKTRSFLFYLKKAGSTPATFPVVELAYFNSVFSTYRWFSYSINPFTGATTHVSGDTAAAIAVTSVGSFWEIKISYAANGASGYNLFWVVVKASQVASGSPSVEDNTLTGAVTIWGPQIIEESSVTSHFSQQTGDCILAAAAYRGNRKISVTNSLTNPKDVGDWFEIDGRAHIIHEIDGTNWTIWPSLRKDYASGTVLEVDDPRVKCYLTPDSRGAVMNTDARQLTLMSLQFVEAGW